MRAARRFVPAKGDEVQDGRHAARQHLGNRGAELRGVGPQPRGGPEDVAGVEQVDQQHQRLEQLAHARGLTAPGGWGRAARRDERPASPGLSPVGRQPCRELARRRRVGIGKIERRRARRSGDQFRRAEPQVECRRVGPRRQQPALPVRRNAFRSQAHVTQRALDLGRRPAPETLRDDQRKGTSRNQPPRPFIAVVVAIHRRAGLRRSHRASQDGRP
ncbi:hypothetical protein C3E99_05770 [Sphingopyxis sp. MG]|nr:hypothetical protein C3E99_05770 [Sphingopyxis sp. MG]